MPWQLLFEGRAFHRLCPEDLQYDCGNHQLEPYFSLLQEMIEILHYHSSGEL